MPTSPSTPVPASGRETSGRPESAPAGPWTSAGRRQLGRVLLFVCTPGLVLGASTLATASALGAFDPAPQTVQASCHQQQADLASFEVAVFNGSGISGQARKGAGQLTKAGFRVARVGTAAEGRWTDAAAVITFGPDGRGAAQLVADHIPGAVQVSTVRVGRDVDVVLGTQFRGVSATAVASSASSATVPSCSSSAAR